jgi:hypothetical protein
VGPLQSLPQLPPPPPPLPPPPSSLPSSSLTDANMLSIATLIGPKQWQHAPPGKSFQNVVPDMVPEGIYTPPAVLRLELSQNLRRWSTERLKLNSAIANLPPVRKRARVCRCIAAAYQCNHASQHDELLEILQRDQQHYLVNANKHERLNSCHVSC